MIASRFAAAALTLACLGGNAAAATPDSVDALAKDARSLASELIRAINHSEVGTDEKRDRMTELLKMDPTIALGNHAASLSSWGTDGSNVVLARHSTARDRVQPCYAERANLESVKYCIGGLREMNNFKIVQIDPQRLSEIQTRMVNLKKAPQSQVVTVGYTP